MHSDEEIASYLRSISRGGKVNVVLLQQRTEFFYVKYKNQMYATNYSDQEVFEIAVIEAFKEVQLVNSAQHSQDHHAQQPPVLVPDQPHVQLQQAPVHPFLGGDQPHVQLQQIRALQQMQKVCCVTNATRPWCSPASCSAAAGKGLAPACAWTPYTPATFSRWP